MVYLRMFMHSIFGLLGLDLYNQSITSDKTKCCVLAKKKAVATVNPRGEIRNDS